MSKEIIQALKDNDVAFGLMPFEMQVKAKEIGQSEFSMYMKNNTWMRCGHVNNFYDSIVTDQTYRLRLDYEAPEAPEAPEAEVATLKGMQGCAWEDAEGDTIAAVNELQDACDIIIDTVQAMIESKQ